MARVLVGLGANLGDRRATITRAMDRLVKHASSGSARQSSLHETLPIGGPAGQGAFLNASISFETTLTPEALHRACQQIEAELGRQRGERWDARTIDLDLLLYNQRILGTSVLQIPHPRMAFRRFVLAPAAEVAGSMRHPLIGWSVEQLLANLDKASPYVAILGSDDNAVTRLGQAAAAASNAEFVPKSAETTALGAAGDPSGHAPVPPIQFLDRAAKVLADYDWESGRTLISGFYLDALLADWTAGTEDVDSHIAKAWRSGSGRIVRPKLLVVLDEWETIARAREDTTQTEPTNSWERLLQRTARGAQPWLAAGRDNFDIQLAEITAAVAAMR